jgi:ABC-type oligopeptide transport system substrate-binding subunit
MVMEKRNSLMKKHSVLLAAAVLAISTGIAQAKTSDHRMTGSSYGTGMTGDPSSTNVLARSNNSSASNPIIRKLLARAKRGS